MLVKICGITNFEDAVNAVEAGADMLGFVFYGKSKRYVDPETAAGIVREVLSFVTCVGVFVNESIDEIKRMIDITMIDAVQLSGDETPEICNSLKNFTTVIKSFRVGDGFNPEILSQYEVDYYLLDSFSLGEYGGTGKSFNWDLAVGLERFGKIILSGGLNPENVYDAILKVRPFGVDVSSGVEISPGRKDPEKLRLFIERAKGVKF